MKPPGHGEQSGPKKPLQQRGVVLVSLQEMEQPRVGMINPKASFLNTQPLVNVSSDTPVGQVDLETSVQLIHEPL